MMPDHRVDLFHNVKLNAPAIPARGEGGSEVGALVPYWSAVSELHGADGTKLFMRSVDAFTFEFRKTDGKRRKKQTERRRCF